MYSSMSQSTDRLWKPKMQKNVEKDGLIGSPTAPNFEIIQEEIRQGTLKQAKYIDLGQRFYPEQELQIETPTLLPVKPGETICVSQNAGSLGKIFQDFSGGVIHFTGPAGSGKTTLLKEICKKVYEKDFESLRDVDIILFLKCSDLNTMKKISPVDLLLSYIEPELDKVEKDAFEEVLKTMPERVLIIFDGLDTFPDYYYDYPFNTSKKMITNSSKMMRVYDIIVHLLHSRLYPGCRIITSARDMDLGRLATSPQLFVYLLGLGDHSIYNICRQYLQPVDVHSLIAILDAHPNLKDLCRVPMFLVSVLWGRKSNEEFCNIDSITDNLLVLIKRFIDSQETLMEITDIKNLKRLAFDLLKDHTLNFTPQALEQHHLSVESINSLVFVSPNGRNRVLFFVHQFIHEVFAALHLAGLEVDLFKAQFQECMDKPWFSFSNLMMCRIVCNNKTYELAKKHGLLQEDDTMMKKRQILLALMKDKVSQLNKEHPMKDLFTFLVLNECGESVKSLISQDISTVNLDFKHLHSLWISDIYALMSVGERSGKLESLSLSRSWISRPHVHAMWYTISQRPFTITRLDFSGNLLSHDAMVEIGYIAMSCQSEELDLSSCQGLWRDDPEMTLAALKEGLQQHKLKVLNVSYLKKSLEECEMKKDVERKSKTATYKIDKEPDPECPVPGQITLNYAVIGKWRNASYDFVRALVRLMQNVTERMVVHCWKFSDEWKRILQTMPMDVPKKLQIQLSEGDFLEVCAVKNRNFNPRSATIPIKVEEHSVRTPLHPLKEPNTIQSEKPSIILKTTEIQDKHKLESHSPCDNEGISTYKVTHRPVTENDLKNVINILLKRQRLDELELRDCDLDEVFLQKLLNKVRKLGDVKISKLSITATDGMDILFPLIGELMSNCATTELNIEESKWGKKGLDILGKSIKENKVELLKLDLSYTDGNDFSTNGQLFSSRLTELKLVGCHLEMNDLKNMNLPTDSKIASLDISYNCQLDEESVQFLSTVLSKDDPLAISMVGCDLTVDELTGFEEFNSMEIQKLDLSYNDSLESDGIEEVGRIARKHSTTDVSLSACGLDEESLRDFIIGLDGHKLRGLNLSRNTKLASCPEKIVELLDKCDVSELDISECRMTSFQIAHFAECLKKRSTINQNQLRVNLSDTDRRRVDSRYADAVVRLLQSTKCQFIMSLPRARKDEKNMFKDRLSKSSCDWSQRLHFNY